MKVDLVVRFFNEHIYAEHFIRYYLGLGFDRIHILYQSGQTPISITNDKVSLIRHNHPGNEVFHHMTSLVATTADWILMCDADEYLYIREYKNIKAFLKMIPADIDQLFFQWAMIENYTYMTGKSDLFDILTTHKLYQNSHIKSMIRLELFKKGHFTAHLCSKGVQNYLWDRGVECIPRHEPAVENYTSTTYPFLIHFHTRSLQNTMIKGITTFINNTKKMDLDALNAILTEPNLDIALKPFVKLRLPFCHAHGSVIPMKITLKSCPVDYNKESAMLERICRENNINYSLLTAFIKRVSDKFSEQFKLG